MIAAVLAAALLAAPVVPGFYAEPSAANVIGVQTLDALAGGASLAIRRQLGASRTLRAVAIDTDPSAGDCSGKPYAAAVQLSTSTYRTGGGWYLDTGMRLVDCAGWNVDQWHDGRALTHVPDDADTQRAGMDLLIRLRTWALENPALSHELFARGLAYDPASAAPTFFYTLFKSEDGYMRALVRPGGPAYVAGMRSNDVVDKLDGKFWWEYGTYQTQRRAYDGLPHTFEITRGKATVKVALGAPFRLEAAAAAAP